MNPQEIIPDVKPAIGIQAWFKRTGDSYFVNSPCVFTENKSLTLKEVYEIHDFTEPEVKLIYIKLLWVYLKGFKLHIVGAEITNGDLKMYSQRLNTDSLPCSFLICDLLYFDEDIVDKIFKSLEDEDLLDFDFKGNE